MSACELVSALCFYVEYFNRSAPAKGNIKVSTYSFRLRFNFPDSCRIASDATELVLWARDELQLKLKSGATGAPLKDTPRAAILGGPFETREQARYAAEQTKRAILFWAVEQRVGVDFGDGKQRGSLTAEGIRYFEELHCRPIRFDKHGIDVFETIEDIGFLNIGFEAQIGKAVEALIGTFHAEFPKHTAF